MKCFVKQLTLSGGYMLIYSKPLERACGLRSES
uniref:Uncharacterized protein n=1 Tax=Anguilla anguilla TaxID=7936 RepID=A0A0E9TBB9_ANGAN